MELPTIEELEIKLKVHFGKKTYISANENIFFRIFGIDMIIPKGFKSDGASLPFFIKGFTSKFNELWLFGAIVHDYLYRTQFVPKMIADLVFYYILKDTANKPIAFLFYEGVHLGGGIAWYRNKKKLEKFPRAKHDLKLYLCKQ